MLLIVLPIAYELPTAIVVGVLTVAVALVVLELAGVLGDLVRPLERTVTMLHVVGPLAVVDSSIWPLEQPFTINDVINEVAFEKSPISELQNSDASLDPLSKVPLKLRAIWPLFNTFSMVVATLKLPRIDV